MNRAVFFDRDNTIMYDVPYCGDPSRVRLMPNVVKALSLLKGENFLLFLITNQSGVGRGMINEEQVHAVHEEINRQLGEHFFSAIYCCYDDPAHPVENCRKPSPKMILQARDEHDLDLLHSFFIGDKLSDVKAGKNAGCRSILLKLKENEESHQAALLADYVTADIYKAAQWIIQRSGEIGLFCSVK
jgi:D-glycero-D-manno-heptose 1,7-bisphosphate phosphatase